MVEVGNSLRAAREKRGLSLADVQEATRMRARLLRALEEERFDLFPSEFYARSFLRGYADFLGLDGAVFAEEYRERFEQVEESLPERPRRPRVEPRRAAWAVGVLVAVVAGVLLAFTSGGGHRRTAPTEPTVHTTAPRRPVVSEARAPKRRPLPRVALTAARGSCWLLVRAGSASGPVLYEGTLASGSTLVFRRRFLWLRAGAPWTMAVRLNGKLLPPLGTSGTPVNVLLTPKGASPG